MFHFPYSPNYPVERRDFIHPAFSTYHHGKHVLHSYRGNDKKQRGCVCQTRANIVLAERQWGAARAVNLKVTQYSGQVLLQYSKYFETATGIKVSGHKANLRGVHL